MRHPVESRQLRGESKPEKRTRILIVHCPKREGRRLGQELGQALGAVEAEVTYVTSLEDDLLTMSGHGGHRFDVVVAIERGDSLAIVTAVLAGLPSLGNPELFVICEERDSPSFHALGAAGVRCYSDIEEAVRSLSRCHAPLRRRARARRAFADATHELERLKSDTVNAHERRDLGMPLPQPLAVAETKYREAYVRAVLALAGTRHAAARLAGVPYRTFCLMIRKLAIEWPTPRPTETGSFSENPLSSTGSGDHAMQSA